MMRYATTAIIFVLMAGCATGPVTSYYTLDMRPSGQAQAKANFQIGRLRVAEALLERNVLIMKSPTEIEYYAANEWAAGLDELVTEKLLTEFGPSKDGAPLYFIEGAIQAFGQVDIEDGAEAHAKLSLKIRPNGTSRYSDPVIDKTYEARLPAEAPNAGAIVRALSDCLSQIAKEISGDLSSLPTNN